MTWQLQEAKNKFSEVVERALTEGPQTISRRGKNTVVVVNYQTFSKTSAPRMSFKQLIQEYAGADFPDVPRDKGDGRATPFHFDEIKK